MNVRSVLAAILVLLPASADAHSLKEALVLAYQSSPDLAAEREALAGIDETAVQALARHRPSIEGTFGRAWSRYNTDVRNETVTRPWGYGVTARLPIYRGGRDVAAQEKAEAAILAGRARLRGVEQSVLYETASAYAALYRDRLLLALATSELADVRTSLNVVKARHKLGSATDLDVSVAEVSLARVTAQRVAALGAVRQSEAWYVRLVGSLPTGELRLDGVPMHLPSSLDEALAQARETPSVVAARHLEEGAAADVKSARGALLPSLDLQAQRSHQQRLAYAEDKLHVNEITLRLTIPLYQGGAGSSQVREKLRLANQQRWFLESEIRRAGQDIAEAWQRVQTSRAQMEAYTEAARVAKIGAERVQDAYRIGSYSIVDVIETLREGYRARSELISARCQTLIAEFKLMAATGWLTAEALDLGVPIYDPTKHYNEAMRGWMDIPGIAER